MFRVVSQPIIRSTHNSIYSIWYLSNRYYYLPLLWKCWNWFECGVEIVLICTGAVATATAPVQINTLPLSWNLGTLTSWNHLGHSRLVTGLLYLYLYILKSVTRKMMCQKSLRIGICVICSPWARGFFKSPSKRQFPEGKAAASVLNKWPCMPDKGRSFSSGRWVEGRELTTPF